MISVANPGFPRRGGRLTYYYRPQRSWGKVIFSEACVNNSVHRGGACIVAPGGACVVALGGGGLGACVVAPGGVWGHAWLLRGGMRGCPQGGMHGCSGGGCAWLLQGGMCGCSWGDMRGCSGGTWLLPGGHAWLLLGGHAWLLRGGACVVFSMRYGQWAGGTHPTGMHSCLHNFCWKLHENENMDWERGVRPPDP